MSKKQREKVEDEVRYHRAQMKIPPGSVEATPDSYTDPTSTSSDPSLSYNQHTNTYNPYVGE
jgi:hypothetical protein